ncbi:MAG: EF-P beta-lysylation protein EpmB [Acidobacteriota bacterium]
MIPESPPIAESPAPPAESDSAPWRRALAGAVRDVDRLLALLDLDRATLAAAGLPVADAGVTGFPLRVPHAFVARMRRADPHDPLLRQVLSAGAELEPTEGYVEDPLAEAEATTVPGLLHKYRGRVLLVVTGACAVHCRYCFRRHFPYGEHQPHEAGWAAAVDAIADDPSIDEVILSGGDPLSVSDDKLARLVARLAAVPHLRRLRVHTRLPIVLPERVDAALLGWLTAAPALRPVVVVHANHEREIDPAVADAAARLRGAGVQVLNQAVLLAGVNDSVRALRDLSVALFDAGIMPYYLHLLDRVHGAAHFEVATATARRLIHDLTAELPGYLVPRLVREDPRAPSKTPLGPVCDPA